MALAAYATEYGDVQQLTGIQLDLAGKVVKVLGYIEEITKSVSTETSLCYRGWRKRKVSSG